VGLGVLLIIAALTTVRLWPRAPLSERIATSSVVFDQHGRLMRLTLAHDEQYRVWTPLKDVSPAFIEALLLHEDRRFHYHFGVDPPAVARAAYANIRGGRQGGSTLTMQLARLLHGINTRCLSGKLEQVARALALELQYSKRELLEAHMNLMPYGGNVQGVGAASLIYFGKPPSHLSLPEALALVVIPQAPARRAPTDGTEPPSLLAARQRLFKRWVETHPQDADHRELINAPLRYKDARSLPFEAPHVSNSLLARRHGAQTLRTTIDLRRQRLVERVLEGYIREQSRLGVRNAAALLVDYRDLSVPAVVGSARFFDSSISGQVNGTLAKRSPGSALKPFIYALAIDQGIIHPMSVLKDAPTSFGVFSPENFDGRFVGPINATEALIRSRNIPAVALSAQLAQPGFYQFLRSAGISKMSSEQHYGLALALGGGEVTMEETAMLYAMLASGGVLRPLRYTVDEPVSAGVRLLSEAASFMTAEMLKENPRPDDSVVRPRGYLPVAWKTGTSWGFRDAWSAGIFGHYVLVVWVGNFDGSSNPAFVGLHTAAPLLFRIVDALSVAERGLAETALRRPASVTRVKVCAASGELPNADCPRTALTWFIPGKSPIRVSTVHRRIFIDTRTGQQACPPFDAHYMRSEVFELWPSDVLELFAQAGMPRRRPPALPAGCHTAGTEGPAPRISSPLSSATYSLRAASMRSGTIPLAATADAQVHTLHWFVDDAYVGTSRPNVAVPWAPGRSGDFVVRVVDDRGRADSRNLRVAVVP
jgi:penicillin-binding protein 1C